MDYTMTDLKNTKIQKSVNNAIENCKKNRPKVLRIDAKHVAVANGDKTKYYTVRIERPRAEILLAECSCEAHDYKKGKVACWHMIAALSAPEVTVSAKDVLIKGFDGIHRVNGWAV